MEMYLTGEVKLIEYENSNGEHELVGHIYDDTVNYEHCLEVAYGLGYPKPATVEQANSFMKKTHERHRAKHRRGNTCPMCAHGKCLMKREQVST